MYFLTRVPIGTSAAVLVMIALMLPLFFIAMYEKDGLPAEVVLRNILRAKFWPGTRPYQTENLYEYLEEEAKNIAIEEQTTRTAAAPPTKKHRTSPKK